MKSAKGLLWSLLASLLLSILPGCKGKQAVVERVRYVHDTAWSVRDSTASHTLAFGGTVAELTAEWTGRGGGRPDTVWRYRWKTVAAQGTGSSHAKVEAAGARQLTDSTATATTQGKVKPEKRAPGKDRTARKAALWLLSVAAAFVGGVVLGGKARKK